MADTLLDAGPEPASGGRDFAAVLGHRPAVRVDLSEESPFARLVVSVGDAEGTSTAIRGAVGI